MAASKAAALPLGDAPAGGALIAGGRAKGRGRIALVDRQLKWRERLKLPRGTQWLSPHERALISLLEDAPKAAKLITAAWYKRRTFCLTAACGLDFAGGWGNVDRLDHCPGVKNRRDRHPGSDEPPCAPKEPPCRTAKRRLATFAREVVVGSGVAWSGRCHPAE